jgi:hypothetical protein
MKNLMLVKDRSVNKARHRRFQFGSGRLFEK